MPKPKSTLNPRIEFFSPLADFGQPDFRASVQARSEDFPSQQGDYLLQHDGYACLLRQET